VGIALEQGEELSVVRLEGAIDIAAAAELKQRLLEAFASGHEVRVELAGVTDLDVTAVQLLWAARRQAEVAGAGFAFAGKLPEPVTGALVHAGLDQFLTDVNGSQASEVKPCQP
jgi:anti-anti-sigma factor